MVPTVSLLEYCATSSQCPSAMKASMSSSQRARMRGSIAAAIFGVKAVLARRRTRLCSGGSLSSMECSPGWPFG